MKKVNKYSVHKEIVDYAMSAFNVEESSVQFSALIFNWRVTISASSLSDMLRMGLSMSDLEILCSKVVLWGTRIYRAS